MNIKNKCLSCYHRKICIDSANQRLSEKCRQYKDEALIAELPCSIGAILYIVIEELPQFGGTYIKEERVVEISTTGRIWTDADTEYDEDDIGKIAFMTYEEAQQHIN